MWVRICLEEVDSFSTETFGFSKACLNVNVNINYSFSCHEASAADISS